MIKYFSRFFGCLKKDGCFFGLLVWTGNLISDGMEFFGFGNAVVSLSLSLSLSLSPPSEHTTPSFKKSSTQENCHKNAGWFVEYSPFNFFFEFILSNVQKKKISKTKWQGDSKKIHKFLSKERFFLSFLSFFLLKRIFRKRTDFFWTNNQTFLERGS